MKIFLCSIISTSGLVYDIEDVSIVTDSTFIAKIHKNHEKDRYLDSDLFNKISKINDLEELRAFENKIVNKVSKNFKFEYCDAYLKDPTRVYGFGIKDCPKLKA